MTLCTFFVFSDLTSLTGQACEDVGKMVPNTENCGVFVPNECKSGQQFNETLQECVTSTYESMVNC
ncbi:5512_t:CDS:2 [Gigaspora margarita]|uniref:5512_t:CDS:1 n=1 Tax=Gigaspora margarita TaxID=4874 RepID=A0ABM8VVW0_GIGMA|nr:5512_t:CDS:2 [Gigaspora margarita]